MSSKPILNKKKSVLMICYYFFPFSAVGALRSTKFVKYLGDFGWHSKVLTRYRMGNNKDFKNRDVEVYTVPDIDLGRLLELLVRLSYSCIRWAKKLTLVFKNAYSDRNVRSDFTFVNPGGLGVANRIQHLMRLPDLHVLWILLAFPKAISLARKCNVVYTSLSPHSAHVLGLIIKKLTNKPWVADYRDEWSLNPTWRPATPFHKWLAEKLDEACVRNADLVVNTTEIRTRMFLDRFGGFQEKYVTIHNGYDEDDIVCYRDIEPPDNGLIITSIGSLNAPRDATFLLHAIARLLENGTLERQKVIINMIGGYSYDLADKIERLQVSNIIKVFPRIPQDQAFFNLAKSHVALLVGSYYEKVAMTTKAYEYAGMGKPIFALVPQGPLYDFVKNCGGWCASPDSSEEIEKALLHILNQHDQKKLGTNIFNDFVRKYERRRLTRLLAAAFNSCIIRE